MSYRLYVRPVPPFAALEGAMEDQRFNWALVDASGVFQAQGQDDMRHNIEQTLAQNDLDHVRMIGLVPGDEVLFCFAEIPAKQSRYIRQALPFAVEEQLAQDIDSVHLALGEQTGRGFRVAAIDRQRMAIWQELFEAWQGVRLDAMYPDAALLPVNESQWVLCIDGGDTLVAGAGGEWFRMNTANLGIFTQTLAQPAEDEVSARIGVTIYGNAADMETNQPFIQQLEGEGRLSVSRETLELMPLELLAHAHHRQLSHPINLFQGRFALMQEGSGAWRVWRPVAVVAALWLALQLCVEVGLGYYHSQQADELSAQAMTIYHKAFPGDDRTNPDNVKRVLQGQLRVANQNGSSEDFLALLRQAGAEYAQAGGNGKIRFETVNYSRQRGELVVDLKADNYDRLSTLRSALGNRGLEARIGSVVNENSGTSGRLTLSGG